VWLLQRWCHVIIVARKKVANIRGNLSSMCERCIIFRFRVNDGNVTDGRRVTRGPLMPIGIKIDSFVLTTWSSLVTDERIRTENIVPSLARLVCMRRHKNNKQCRRRVDRHGVPPPASNDTGTAFCFPS